MPANPPTVEDLQDPRKQPQLGTGINPGLGTPVGQYGGINPGATMPPAGGGGANPSVGAGGPAPSTVGTGSAAPWYTQNDIGQFQSWAQNRYGRQATPDELARIGANSTDMGSAQSYADTLARSMGWQGGGPPPPPTPTGPTYTPGPGTAPPTVGAGAGPDPLDQQAQQVIQRLLGTNTGDVNTASQEYQSQLGAFKRGQSKALERAKLAAANRGGGNVEGAMQGMDLAAANAEGDFTAQLAGQQLGRQREDLQQGLALAQQRGLTTQAQDLQTRLANLDANLRQQGMNLQGELGRGQLGLQGELGRGDLDLRRYLGRGQLGLGLLGALLNDRQANNQLGFNYAQLGNMMNQQTLQALLGGLG